jgi:hypothetical protein
MMFDPPFVRRPYARSVSGFSQGSVRSVGCENRVSGHIPLSGGLSAPPPVRALLTGPEPVVR